MQEAVQAVDAYTWCSDSLTHLTLPHLLMLLQAGIALPSALGGMLGLTGLLMVFGPRASDEMVRFYDSHLAWTSQLLPLSYVPALAVLPVLLHGMPGECRAQPLHHCA